MMPPARVGRQGDRRHSLAIDEVGEVDLLNTDWCSKRAIGFSWPFVDTESLYGQVGGKGHVKVEFTNASRASRWSSLNYLVWPSEILFSLYPCSSVGSSL